MASQGAHHTTEVTSNALPNNTNLLQKPASGGTPARANREITIPKAVIGILLPNPFSLSM